LGIDAYLFGSIEFIVPDLFLKTTNAEKSKGYSVRCSCGGLVGAVPVVIEVGQPQHYTGFGCVRVRVTRGFSQPPFQHPYFQYFFCFLFFFIFLIFFVFFNVFLVFDVFWLFSYF